GEIAAEEDDVDAAIVFVDFGKHFERIVAAAIVDKNELVGFGDAVHHFGQLHVQSRYVFLFVEERNDNRVPDAGDFISHSLGQETQGAKRIPENSQAASAAKL